MAAEKKLSYEEEQCFYLLQAERKLRLLRAALLKPGGMTAQRAEAVLIKLRSGDNSVYPDVAEVYKRLHDTALETIFWDAVQVLGMLDAAHRGRVPLRLNEM